MDEVCFICQRPITEDHQGCHGWVIDRMGDLYEMRILDAAGSSLETQYTWHELHEVWLIIGEALWADEIKQVERRRQIPWWRRWL